MTTIADESLRPTAGARYAVELASFDGETAVYEGFVHQPNDSRPLRVRLAATGSSAEVEGEDPGGAHAKAALALLKAAAKLPRGEGAGPPPRRVVRWRS